MNKDIAMAWADELESGKHKQGRGYLEVIEDGVSRLCCLGVLSNMAAKAGVCERKVGPYGNVTFHDKDANYGNGSLLTPKVMEWAGMDTEDGMCRDRRQMVEGKRSRALTILNDGAYEEFGEQQEPLTFAEIAKVIRDNYEYL